MIRAVLSHYGVTVSDRPVWQRVSCPVHDDAHASASVMTFGAERLVCHVCGKTWNPLELLMEMEGLTKDAAERRAEEIAGEFGETVQQQPLEGNRLPGSTRSLLGLRGQSATRVRR